MSQVAVVHYIGATARSLTVVASVVADLRDDGNDVSVVDLEPTTQFGKVSRLRRSSVYSGTL